VQEDTAVGALAARGEGRRVTRLRRASERNMLGVVVERDSFSLVRGESRKIP
jgi:hypothetical protein